MLALADQQSPDRVRSDYEQVYREMRAAGYTAVGEFHYLGFEQALAAAEAADAAGITFVLLYVAYARGGLDRFRQPSAAEYLNQVERLRERGIQVGLAPHSVRACPPDWLEEIGRYAGEHSLPLHVHADEQPREIDECVEEHGVRPIELLARTGCLGPRTTVVHATHANDLELDLIAEAGARICACPTTEANLGDGFLAGGTRLRAKHRDLHRLRLERPDRPAGGAPRARGHRPPHDAAPQRDLARHPALLRRRRGRRGARARRLGRRRGRPRAPVARRDRRVGRVRRARLRLLGRRVRLENPDAEGARGELDGEAGRRVLVVPDRVHLNELERVEHARLRDQLQGKMGLPVGESSANRIPTPGRDLGIDDVEVDRDVDERATRDAL